MSVDFCISTDEDVHELTAGVATFVDCFVAVDVVVVVSVSDLIDSLSVFDSLDSGELSFDFGTLIKHSLLDIIFK